MIPVPAEYIPFGTFDGAGKTDFLKNECLSIF